MSDHDPDRMVEALNDAFDPIDLDQAGLQTHLGDLVDIAGRVFGADGAGLMLLDPQGGLALAGASTDVARAFERKQHEIGAGPGIESVQRQNIVTVQDLTVDPRWPQLTAGLAGLTVGGVLSAPIAMQQQVMGHLNLLESTPRVWSEADISRAQALAGVAAISLRAALDAHTKGQLISELRRRWDRASGDRVPRAWDGATGASS